MIGCAFLLFTLFLVLFNSLSGFKILANLSFKYALVFICSALTFAPFYQGFSLSVLLYSFFDAPSALCVLLMGFLCFKIFYKDFSKKALNIHIKTLSFVLLFVFCVFVFLGNLALIRIDIYNENAFMQGIFIFVFLILLYMVDKFFALLALVSLLSCFLGQNLIKALFDSYLFIFSLVFLSFKFIVFIKGKLCKKVLR